MAKKKYITPKEAAAELGISVQAVYKKLARGLIIGARRVPPRAKKPTATARKKKARPGGSAGVEAGAAS